MTEMKDNKLYTPAEYKAAHKWLESKVSKEGRFFDTFTFVRWAQLFAEYAAEAREGPLPQQSNIIKEEFRREFPELFRLWESAPIALGIINESRAWLEFAEYVRTKSEGSLARNPNAPCKNCGHPWDEEVAEAQQAMREGSLRTPTAPLLQRIYAHIDSRKEMVSGDPALIAELKSLKAEIAWLARGEASQPAPTPQNDRERIIWNEGRLAGLAEGIERERKKSGEAQLAPQPTPPYTPWKFGGPLSDGLREAEAPAQPSPLLLGQCDYWFHSRNSLHQKNVYCLNWQAVDEAAASPSAEPTKEKSSD